jgi:hypothetical protein
MAKMKARDEELIEKSGKPEVKAAFEEIAEGWRSCARSPKASVEPAGHDAQSSRRLRRSARPRSVINQARFDVYGTANYPDATFTLRLAYGTVKGYEAGTTLVPAEDHVERPVRAQRRVRQQGAVRPAAALARREVEAQPRHAVQLRLHGDIIGGNSGSPILNRNAEVVGLVFDGNIESLPGNYWFDERVNRCVGVHTGGMLEAIEKVYGEHDLVRELRDGK